MASRSQNERIGEQAPCPSFTCDGNLFVCKTHGSVYDPRAGKCVGGPGQGKSLERLPLVVDAGAIYLDWKE